ncbi:hypothetical protein POX_b03151 [Penicillium oxalicum]|uniref:hypothetical protein n=1 Tax=Penicillium oxalicum TaxID=69781 RepID=UPI0020B69287|nr:hypothetical protein POX_b03151 [Penicillium oxalicum]KAI2793103.1 hypothetical protein POX_b03151 [Penicillium oxalicum]
MVQKLPPILADRHDAAPFWVSYTSTATLIAQAGPKANSQTATTQSASHERLNGPIRAAWPPVAPEAPVTITHSGGSERKVPNVFEFLEKDDESSDSSASSSSSSSESESSDDEEPATKVHAQAIAKIQSPKPRANLASHAILNASKPLIKPSSTVAPRSNPVHSPIPPPAPTAPAPAPAPTPVPVDAYRLARRSREPSPKASATESTFHSEKSLAPSRPENLYQPDNAPALLRDPFPPSPPSSPEESTHAKTISRRQDLQALRVSSGYGLIASQLTRSTAQEKAAFPPLYRRFESVNHRVLLHLQDEIAQMEEDLNTLDEYEEIHRVATAEQQGTKPAPASRRTEVQAQAYSSLHYRRMDLMAALIQKTEQYNTALSAYSKVLQTLPGASEEAITNYRSWMREHGPIAASETRFLESGTDLVALTPRLAASAAAAPVYIAILIAAGALLIPLLAFTMIAEFLGRLVVVTVIAGAAAVIAANYSSGIEALVDSRDGWKCAAMYFGFMTFAAMFIP